MHFQTLITRQLPTFQLSDYAMHLYEVFHLHETFLVLCFVPRGPNLNISYPQPQFQERQFVTTKDRVQAGTAFAEM